MVTSSKVATPVVAFLSASIPLLSPVLRNNWKVPEPACNCLGSLSNFRCAAATDPREACYLLNFAKNSQFSGECSDETGSYLTAHTTIQSPRTADFQAGSKRAVSVGIFAGIVPLFRSPVTLAVSQGRFLASRLCIQKFRSPWQGVDGQCRSAICPLI